MTFMLQISSTLQLRSASQKRRLWNIKRIKFSSLLEAKAGASVFSCAVALQPCSHSLLKKKKEEKIKTLHLFIVSLNTVPDTQALKHGADARRASGNSTRSYRTRYGGRLMRGATATSPLQSSPKERALIYGLENGGSRLAPKPCVSPPFTPPPFSSGAEGHGVARDV